MKILIVSTLDIKGGAAKAAYRLHHTLLKAGIDSHMLVQNKLSDDHTVIGPASKLEMMINIARPTLDRIPLLFYKQRKNVEFYPAFLPFSRILKKIEQINPDMVHLHWINGGMLRIEDIAKIKVPVVWSLHDMWPFTGGCHYDENCGLYESNCGTCKVLGSNKEEDLSRKVFNRKLKTFPLLGNLTIVGLSRWMADCAKRSILFRENNVVHLPNPINTNRFKILDKTVSRELWNLSNDKRFILFGAVDALDDPRKGFNELSNALNQMTINNVELVVFGSSKPENIQEFRCKIHYLGHLHDEESLVTLYNAVDIMIVPSIQENLSNAIMESMACGTPVVAFDIGGNGDMIDHKENGYLATPFESKDLARGIDLVLEDEEYDQLCKNAREKILKEFDSKIVSNKYVALYESVLNEK